MRPWKATLLVALWPLNESVPAVTVRVHLLCTAPPPLWARHLLPTLRPLTRRVKLNVTLACWLSEKEKTLPTGGLLVRRLICASLLPSRHTRFDWVTSLSTSGVPLGVVPVGVVPVGVVPVLVAAAWTVALSSRR